MVRTKRSARLILLPRSQSKRRANAASAPATTRRRIASAGSIEWIMSIASPV
jgi:hypothetical protein